MNAEKITHAYIMCALWASVAEEGHPMDEVYEPGDIALGSLQAATIAVVGFVDSNRELLIDSGLTDEQIGHDFWLTRNHHGAGFWDRDIGEIGVKLTEAAHAYGSVDCYVGDNGEVYIS